MQKAVLVDIPIGLPGKARLVGKQDVLARKMLGRRRSCVFSPGVHDILKYTDCRAVSDRNRTLTGKKISLQYWHLVEKTKEIDSFICSVPATQGVVKESHPQVCFEKVAITQIYCLKKSKQGACKRMEILAESFPDSQSVFTRVMKLYPRRDIDRDDIVDAMMLAVTARESRGEPCSPPTTLERDEKGLPMATWYHDFEGDFNEMQP